MAALTFNWARECTREGLHGGQPRDRSSRRWAHIRRSDSFLEIAHLGGERRVGNRRRSACGPAAQSDAERATKNLLGALRGVTQSSPTRPKPTFTYYFLRRQFIEQESDRTESMKLFVNILQN